MRSILVSRPLQGPRRAALPASHVLIALALCAALVAVRASACPNCGPPRPALSEQIAEADTVVLIRWVAAQKPPERDPAGGVPEFPAEDASPSEVGSTTYEIVRVAKGGDETVRPGGRIELVKYRSGKPGDLYLLTGARRQTAAGRVDWDFPVEITEAGFAYLEKAPSPDLPSGQRLAYFLKYLEFPDPLVAADAFQEFANAPYEDLHPLVDQMPRDRLRKWIVDDQIVPTRLNLYGMMLGLCGNDEDKELLKKKILAASDGPRPDMPGIMSGYLTLAGEEGLALLEEEKLKPRYVEVKLADGTVKQQNAVPFHETFAALKTLQFMWDYEKDRIPRERLKQAMRIVLEQTELADFAIADLARWKDWEIQDRVMALYGAKGYEAAAIKRAIIGYFLACVRDMPAGATQPPPHVVKARAHLEELRKRDPKLVSDVERFSFFD